MRRQLLSYLAASLAAATTTATAAAHDASIYMFNVDSSRPTGGKQISADAAQLVLAERLGWSGSVLTAGEMINEQVVADLNEFGGHQTAPFDSLDQKPVHRLMLVLEGVDQEEFAQMSKQQSPAIVVSKPPLNIAGDAFIDATLAQSSRIRPDSQLCSLKEVVKGIDSELTYRNKDGLGCPEDSDELYSQLKSIVAGKEGSDATQYLSAVLRLSNKSANPSETDKWTLALAFDYINQWTQEYNFEYTVLLLPGHSWQPHNTKAKAKRYVPETQLPSQIPPISSSSSSSSNENRNTNNETLSIFLPTCYNTNETCAERTNNCSGHGSCYLKRRAPKDKATAKDCYACKCARTTVRTNEDGTVKTAQWGGPACQKKDVTIPFWLLFSLTVLLIIGISLALRLLYSIGQDELPSVLGAGVTAPKGQK